MYEYRAQVLHIVDGDTIDVRVDLGFQMSCVQRLRFARMDTPELNKKEQRVAGLAAKVFLANLLARNADQGYVTIRTTKVPSGELRGKFGRYVVEVLITIDGDEVNVNDTLVKEGHAKYVEY